MFLHQLGEGAGLGPLEPWHAEEFAATVDRAREHLKPWIPFSHRVVDTDTAREFLQGFAEAHAADTRHNFGIWLDGRLVGGAMFVSFDAKLGISELGVWLSPEAEGRGLITQASRCLIDWAIRERGMARVEWHVSPTNERSKAVARRLGMIFEGTLRSNFVVAGRRQDTEVWAMLADEWTAQT